MDFLEFFVDRVKVPFGVAVLVHVSKHNSRDVAEGKADANSDNDENSRHFIGSILFPLPFISA